MSVAAGRLRLRRSCDDAQQFPSRARAWGGCCGLRCCASHGPNFNLVGTNGRHGVSPAMRFIAFYMECVEISGISTCHAINFNNHVPPRHEGLDSTSLHPSIHSHCTFDRFQMCGSTADGAFLTPSTMPSLVTFLTRVSCLPPCALI